MSTRPIWCVLVVVVRTLVAHFRNTEVRSNEDGVSTSGEREREGYFGALTLFASVPPPALHGGWTGGEPS